MSGANRNASWNAFVPRSVTNANRGQGSYGGSQAFPSLEASSTTEAGVAREDVEAWSRAFDYVEKSAEEQSIHRAKEQAAAAAKNESAKTVKRQAGGKEWEDRTLLEWDPAHPRLFIGNLAGEVTDDLLAKAFKDYPSMSKARVVRDKRTTKSRGYGFVSFSDGKDYLQAGKDMHNQYIGSRPVQIKGAKTSVVPVEEKKDDKSKKKKTQAGGHANTGAGVSKKYKRTKVYNAADLR